MNKKNEPLLSTEDEKETKQKQNILLLSSEDERKKHTIAVY